MVLFSRAFSQRLQSYSVFESDILHRLEIDQQLSSHALDTRSIKDANLSDCVMSCHMRSYFVTDQSQGYYLQLGTEWWY